MLECGLINMTNHEWRSDHLGHDEHGQEKYIKPAKNSTSKIRILFNVLVYIFAAIGLFLTVGYAAVNLHLTNAAGGIDQQNAEFEKDAIATITASHSKDPQNIVYVNPAWESTDEWNVTKAGVLKDVAMVNEVSQATGVSSRLIVSQLVGEQLRLYTSERDVFKNTFAPLKILGSQTQFSWGIMGIKEDTAIEVENNLKDPSSPYYLGPQFEHTLDFTTSDPTTERFTRITDQHNHYYAYLYTALYLKEIMTQWKNAGFDISNRPEILSTLYNIGFAHSNPNANPSVGGAEINIDGTTYTFGSLAYGFYYSDQLTDVFPR
jgi:hypothetical protein